LSVEGHDLFIYLGGSAHLAAAVPVRARRAGRNWLVPAASTPVPTDDRAKGETGVNRGCESFEQKISFRGKREENRLERDHFAMGDPLWNCFQAFDCFDYDELPLNRGAFSCMEAL
jgi:hypothetical protein